MGTTVRVILRHCGHYDPKFKGIISEGGEDSNDSSKPATLVETVVEENLFANPSVKSDVKAILGPVASTVFNAQFGHPNVVKGLEDDFVRDALATLTLCRLVTEDAKKILRTAEPEKIKSAAVHTKKTSDNMLVNGDDDEDKMLLSADRMRITQPFLSENARRKTCSWRKLSGKLRALRDRAFCVRSKSSRMDLCACKDVSVAVHTRRARFAVSLHASFSVARALHQLHGDGKASNGANGNAWRRGCKCWRRSAGRCSRRPFTTPKGAHSKRARVIFCHKSILFAANAQTRVRG